VPDAISTGATVWRAKKPSASSSTNTTPATGAWYAAAMPAAMPHTMIALRCSGAIGTMRASHAEDHAASCTIGPSRPIDAPVPIDSIADSERMRLARSLRSTRPCRAASM
jgi:hypothetical protein